MEQVVHGLVPGRPGIPEEQVIPEVGLLHRHLPAHTGLCVVCGMIVLLSVMVPPI